jgi:hypothetical protein
MKLAVLFCAALGVFSFAGATATHKAPDVVTEDLSASETVMTVPLWLALPDQGYVTSVEYTGDAGEEFSRGAVTLDLPSDGQAEMDWLTAHFAGHGYRLDDRGTGPDPFRQTAVAFVTSPDDKRFIVISLDRQDQSSRLRIEFDDRPSTEVASAL